MKKIYLNTFCLFFISLLTAGSLAHAAAPNASNGTANVDGNHGEWNLAADYFADMYRAANPSKKVESKLYLRYDCSAQIMYVLVLTVDNLAALQEAEEAYVKHGTTTKVSDQSGDNGIPPDFAWVTISGVVRGYEASYSMSPSSITNLNVHVNVWDDGESQTSAVANRAIALNAVCPLPVNLTYFTAKNEENAVRLQWQSASEENFQAYQIERSSDARQFASIGRIEAKGSLKGLTSYAYVDAEMPADATTLYYRLKMLDRDGTFAYSKIQAVQRKITTLGLSVEVNPVRDLVRMTVSSPVAQTVQVTLIDNRGQERLRRSLTVAEGQTPTDLNVQRLPTGVYWLLVSDGLMRRSTRILIE